MRGRHGIGFVAAMITIGGGCLQILGYEESRLDEPDAGSGGAGTLCLDGAKNGDETSRDCGGSECAPCKDGDGCEVGPDCESRVCIGGTCIAPGCTDQVKNGDEIDVDCGGACPKCGPDQVCTGDQDCKSNACTNGFCQSTCTDTAKGGDETGVDCGSSECPACPNGEGCAVGPDCESGVCKVELCVDYHVWSKRFGGSGAMDRVNDPRIAVDGSGNAALASWVKGTVDLGGGPLAGSLAYFDVGVARFGLSGNHLWSKRFVGSGQQEPSDVAVTNSGSIVMTGGFLGTVFFDSALTSAGSSDIFVERLSALGVPLSSSRFGDAQPQHGHDVALDSLENICLIGSHEGNVDFGDGPLTSAGGNDFVIAKLDPLGNHLWSKRFGDAQSQYSGDPQRRPSIAVDGADNVLVAGSFEGAINFGGGLLTNLGAQNLFIVKLDSAGTHLWSKRFGDDQLEAGIRGGIVADGSGNVLVSGSFEGTIDFGGGPLTSAGDTDFYVAKLDALGNHLWSKRFGDEMPQVRCDVAVDGVENVLLVGDFLGTIDFGGGPLISAGSADIFVAKFDKLGNHLWSGRFGDVQSQRGYSVAPYDSESVLIAGYFEGSLDFGGGPLVNTGGFDLFLAKLRLP